MSSLSFIGRSLLVLLLTQGLMAHAADEDGELRVNSGVTQTTPNRKSAPKIESPEPPANPKCACSTRLMSSGNALPT